MSSNQLVAPAAFSRQSTGPVQFTGVVSGSEMVEDEYNRVRRLKRPGVVAAASSPKPEMRGSTTTSTSPGKTKNPKLDPSSSYWWTQDLKEVYRSQKIKHRLDKKEKQQAQSEVVLAHEALLRKREEDALERKNAHMVTESISMPMKIEKVVAISKMRDKDIKRSISDLDKKLNAAVVNQKKDKRTLKNTLELIQMKEEELMLTRERMIHLYRTASEVIVKQSQEVSGSEDAELVAYLEKKKDVNAPLVSEMVTHNDIQKAHALYEKFKRIEELWDKLREYAFTVGKVELRRKRAKQMKVSDQRAQYHQAITDTIYNIESNIQPQTKQASTAAKKPFPFGSPTTAQPKSQSASPPTPSPRVSTKKTLTTSRARAGCSAGSTPTSSPLVSERTTMY